MDATKRTARLAGLLYLLGSIPGAFALLYVPGKVFVAGDPVATAERLRSSESVLRLGIAAELLSPTLFIFIALVLYRLFRPVSERAARAMLVLIVVSVPISFLNVLNLLRALMLAGGGGGADLMASFDAQPRDTLSFLAYAAMDLHREGIALAQVFWGLWLFPFGQCVIRSGFIPRFLGYLLWAAGAGYVLHSTAQFAFPRLVPSVEPLTTLLALGEPPIIFWLLIWGAKPQTRSGTDVPSTPASLPRS